MPTKQTENNEKDLVDRYYNLITYYDYDEVAVSKLRELRKEYTQNQEKLHAEKKKLGRDNIELQKWIKEEIKYWMRLEKAANLWVHWWEGNYNDLSFKEWPNEYVNELDYIASVYSLSLYPDYQEFATNLPIYEKQIPEDSNTLTLNLSGREFKIAKVSDDNL